MSFAEIECYNEKRKTRRERSIVDARIIALPSSTKNNNKKRDPEMHQTKKRNQWHFGTKIRIGFDDELGLIHSLEATPANNHDLSVGEKLLHGQEKRLCGDTGYRCIDKREAHQDREKDLDIAEPPSSYMKRVFGYSKVRYRSQTKNRNRFVVRAGLANLIIAHKLLAT